MIEIRNVRWTHTQLATFLDAVPVGSSVVITDSHLFELDGFPIDGWPNIDVEISYCWLQAATDD